MLVRFCLYGFLKNQRYFEPFLLLALLDKDLSYFQVGLLTGLRAVVVNALEIPSGAAADLFGRRRAMVLAFVAYFFSFLAFAAAAGFVALAGAMALFGVGEAFRTGSHKALIFKWLQLEGRSGEKTRVYGLTRSWSKYGSALSALIAAALVYASADYTSVFLWSLLPVGLSIVNLLGYPARIDPRPDVKPSLGVVARHMKDALRDALRRPALRDKLFESMGFNGLFFAVKDYAQPLLVALAAVLIAGDGRLMGPDEVQRTALVTGPVYFVFFLAAGFASRTAHVFARRAGGDDAAARRLWWLLAAVFAVMAAAGRFQITGLVIAGFAAYHVLQNWWRPILTARIYDVVDEKQGTTVLSLESQAHRLGTALLAPAVGWIVDTGGAFWPVAALGCLLALGFVASGRREGDENGRPQAAAS